MSAPLVQLDPEGVATPISYNVPEPISYSGKNYLRLPLDNTAWKAVIDGEPADLPLSPPADPAPGFAPDRVVPANHAREPSNGSQPRLSSVLAPPGIVLLDGADDGPLVDAAARPTSDRLAAVTRADVREAAGRGSRTVLFHNTAGLLDVRTVTAEPTLTKQWDPENGGDGDKGDDYPSARVYITSPGDNAAIHGPGAGTTIGVIGRIDVDADVRDVNLTLQLDDQAPMSRSYGTDGSWSASVDIATAGSHVLVGQLTGQWTNPVTRRAVKVQDKVTVGFTVVLDQGGGDATTPPSVSIDQPVGSPVVKGEETTPITVSGQATWAAGTTLASLVVKDTTTGREADFGAVDAGTSASWSVQLELDGYQRHDLQAIATDSTGQTSTVAAAAVTLVQQLPFRRIKQRLMIVETLNISSFLGAFGAGRCIKTFSLLPGEKTTISVKSWTKSQATSKQGSSIVDSDATESSEDFDDSLSAEQTSKEAQTEATNYKIGATVSACWGWGNASVSGEYSGSSNAARENAVKNLTSATRKHSMKASTNRNVTVNTEYTESHEDGTEDSTTREISNVNVARVLNFVFRQMNQEHVVLVHLTDVRIAVYFEDQMLDADGNDAYRKDPVTGHDVLDIRPSYREVELCDLKSLLSSAIDPSWHEFVVAAIENALTGIPDYQDTLQTVFEVVTPSDKDGTPVESAAYLRFPRGLKQTFVDPVGGATFTVPGIILADDHIVMRTEGVLVDAVLGQGDALDSYSHALQDVATAERQVGVAERQARVDQLALARRIATEKDADAAAIYAKLFPLPPVVPAIELVSSSADGNGEVGQ